MLVKVLYIHSEKFRLTFLVISHFIHRLVRRIYKIHIMRGVFAFCHRYIQVFYIVHIFKICHKRILCLYIPFPKSVTDEIFLYGSFIVFFGAFFAQSLIFVRFGGFAQLAQKVSVNK